MDNVDGAGPQPEPGLECCSDLDGAFYDIDLQASDVVAGRLRVKYISVRGNSSMCAASRMARDAAGDAASTHTMCASFACRGLMMTWSSWIWMTLTTACA